MTLWEDGNALCIASDYEYNSVKHGYCVQTCSFVVDEVCRSMVVQDIGTRDQVLASGRPALM